MSGLFKEFQQGYTVHFSRINSHNFQYYLRSEMPMPDLPITVYSLQNLRPMPNHAGLSGAELLRAELDDGTAVVVKRSNVDSDFFQKLLGHRVNLEQQLWADGTFDLLPQGVSSPSIAAWVDGDNATVVMRDLGEGILGGDHAFTRHECIRLLQRLDELHRSGIRPANTTSLDAIVNTFSVARVRSADPTASILHDIERGWEAFLRLAPQGVGHKVLEIVRCPDALVSALALCLPSFCHGDVAAVNMAWRGDQLVLIDWGQVFIGPAALDIARFLPSGLRSSEIDNDWFLDQYAIIADDRFDERALRLSLLATLVWYGWRKALDATEGPDPALRSIEKAGIRWWCEQAAAGLRELSSRSPGGS
jgi:tRNA A-37 threonylcarbamoyl transferase component Bud32